MTLLSNEDFIAGDPNGPLGWTAHAPREAVRPIFDWSPGHLTVKSSPDGQVFGYWSQQVPVVARQWYRFSAQFFVSGISEPDVLSSALNMVAWICPGQTPRQRAHDIASGLRRSGDTVVATDVFQAPPEATAAEVQLGGRFLPAEGSLRWSRVTLEPCDPPPQRTARVGAVRWSPEGTMTADDRMAELSALLDQAGMAHADLVVLPEACNFQSGVPAEQWAEAVPEGQVCRLIAAKAAEHHMYVAAGVIESADGQLYNSAVLADRSGAIVVHYHKVHPYWPEEMYEGILPGDQFTVFDCDFGRVGIMVCYDSWFPETARILGLKGAELIVFPAAGYEPLILPARAIDTRTYIVASAFGETAKILDTLGHEVASTVDGLVTAVIDLGFRPTPHVNAGGSLNASPGGRRMLQHTRGQGVFAALVEEAERWDERGDQFRWIPNEVPHR